MGRQKMSRKKFLLFRNSLVKKVLVLYTFIMFVLCATPLVSVSNSPEIDIEFPNESIYYTNKSYVNISVNVSDSQEVSSHIDWNNSLGGYWNFESDSKPNFVCDNSTYDNKAYFTDTDKRSWDNRTDGKYGHGLYFNGSSNGYLNVNSSDSLNISDEITIELWFKEFETTFNKTFGWAEGDYGYSVKQTNDGGYILTGECDYSGNNTGDLILIKTDTNGNEGSNYPNTFVKTFDGNNPSYHEDYGRSVRQVEDGGYVVTGISNHSEHDDKYLWGDLWVIKTDSGGNHIKNYTYNGGEKDKGNSITRCRNGGFFITGQTIYDNFFDLILINLDEDLSERYPPVRIGKSNYDEIGRYIQQTEDGNFVVTGYNTIMSGNNEEIWIIKTNETGTEEQHPPDTWNKTHGDYEFEGDKDHGYCIKETADGGYITTGYSKHNDNYKIFLLKTNENGTEGNNYPNTFNKTLSYGTERYGTSVEQTTSEDYVVLGYKRSNPGEDFDIWLVKTDRNGTKLWEKNHTGNKDDRGWNLEETRDGGFIIVGSTNSFGKGHQIWLLKTNSNGNITESNNDQSLNKTLIGKGRHSYQLELKNGTITGYINENTVTNKSSLYDLSQQWNHVVLSYDQSQIKLYLNKELVDNESYTGEIPINYNNLTIGRNFSGIIDEVKLWNRALSREEINESYNSFDGFYKNFSNLSESVYNYSIHSIDSEGNENNTENRTITIDNTSPTVTIAYNDSSRYFKEGDMLKIFANFSENGSGMNDSTVKISIHTSGSNISNLSMNTADDSYYYYNWSVPSDSDGIVNISINAKDSALNSLSGKTYNSSKYIDNTALILTNGIEFNKTENRYNGQDIVRIFANFTETGSGIDEDSVKITITNISSNSALNNSEPLTKRNNTNWYFDWQVSNKHNCNVNISIEANDNVTHSLNCKNYTVSKYIDNSAPSILNITNTTESTSTTINWAVDESCIGHIKYGKTVNYTDTTDNSSGYSTTGDRTISNLEDDTTYHYKLFVYDIAGNMNNSTDYTLHTDVSQDTTNGGTSTNNNGVGTEEESEEQNETIENQNNTNTTIPKTKNITTNIIEKNIGNVTANESKNVNIYKNETVVINVYFKSKENLIKVNLTIIDNKTKKPKNVLSEPLKEDIEKIFKNITIENISIYRYLDIEIKTNQTYIKEKTLENITIRFKVNNHWLDKYNVAITSLLRYHNNTWYTLNTTKISKNENYTIFEAKTPGLSTFAVVGSKVIEKEETNSDDSTQIPWIIIIGFIICSIVVLILILIKAKYIYIEEE